MSKIDDNFEKFLMKKVKEEKSQFNTPFSFNNKIAEVLNEIDNSETNKKKEWFKNKRYLALAATFVFICSLGVIRYKTNYENTGSTVEMARSMDESAYESAEIEESTLDQTIYLSSVINLKEVQKIYINGQKISNEEDMEAILFCLNNMILNNSNEEFNNEEFTIQIEGEEKSTIYMKENLLFINNTVYQGNTPAIEELQKEIEDLILN